MKKIGFMLLSLLFVVFSVSAAQATLIHAGNYTWFDTGGTIIVDNQTGITWTVGDVSGKALVKVQEDVYDLIQSGTPPAGAPPGSIRYVYTITALDGVGTTMDLGGILDFHINDLYNTGPNSIGYVRPVAPGVDWTTTDNPFVSPTWDWYAGIPIGLGAGMVATWDSFEIWSPAPWGYVTGSVTTTSGETIATGVVSAPVPEPGTLMLLGSGLIGIGAYGWRKMRRK